MDGNELKAALNRRKTKLKKMIHQKEKALANAPFGMIHVKNNHGYTQYYLRENPQQRTGRYLRKSEKETIALFMQKRYDEQIVKEAREELIQIDKFLEGYIPGHLADVYEVLDKKSRSYIRPVEVSDEEYVERWLSEQYTGLSFEDHDAEYYATSGLRVRSKSEAMIVNLLISLNIPFRYECPIKLKSGGTYYPDFTILDVKHRRVIYWEHFGMMDDRDYCRRAILKLQDYYNSGHFPGQDLLLTFEASGCPLNIKSAERLLMSMLEG